MFDDNTGLKVWDDGQSCCEERHMESDDDLKNYIGNKFMGLEILGVETKCSDCNEHEIQFLKVITDKGFFKISNHNINNGYYGGFILRCKSI